jgi:SAM-dependent methyltransferase
MKDTISSQANISTRCRPFYPSELYRFILSLVDSRQVAWDCGTGNGQVAYELSQHFEQVYATDTCRQRLKYALRNDNLTYKAEAAETTSFPDQCFDLITVPQAVHRVDFYRFYNEVRRTLKPGGVLALIGHGLVKIEDDMDDIIHHFYSRVIGPYWDKERIYIDEQYQNIPFPFAEIPTPRLFNFVDWTLHQFTGYLKTWPAVQHYMKEHKYNPVDLIYDNLRKVWAPTTTRKIKFPLLLRVAKL